MSKLRGQRDSSYHRVYLLHNVLITRYHLLVSFLHAFIWLACSTQSILCAVQSLGNHTCTGLGISSGKKISVGCYTWRHAQHSYVGIFLIQFFILIFQNIIWIANLFFNCHCLEEKNLMFPLNCLWETGSKYLKTLFKCSLLPTET